MSVQAAILGCSGPELTREEAAFYRDVRPWGFILFARNLEEPDQVRRLTYALRRSVDREDAPILIDQEGGRVQRLRPPHWRRYPPGRAYGQIGGDDPLVGREMARLGARLIAHDLLSLGINVDCIPVLDVPAPDGHEIIGDRAYSDSPNRVAQLGRAAAEGLIAGGVLPVIKHMPGHGRARADTHLELPVVETPWRELSERDFAPFKALSDMPMAMSAHVIYAAVDRRRPATTSKKVFREVIRGAIGFEGLIMTDDLSMNALAGDFTDRARGALAAGCDMILHCNGDLAEMKAVMKGTGSLKGKSERRAKAALARLPKAVEPIDLAEAVARFEATFQGRSAA